MGFLTVLFRARHFPYNATSVPDEYLADNTVDNAKNRVVSRCSFMFHYDSTLPPASVAIRLKL